MWIVSVIVVLPNVCYRNFWENGAMTADGGVEAKSLLVDLSVVRADAICIEVQMAMSNPMAGVS